MKLIAYILLPYLTEQRETAFLRWQRSGYRDFKAHDEFISLRERCMKYHYILLGMR